MRYFALMGAIKLARSAVILPLGRELSLLFAIHGSSVGRCIESLAGVDCHRRIPKIFRVVEKVIQFRHNTDLSHVHSVYSDGFWKQDLDINRKYFRNIGGQPNYSHIIQIIQTRIEKII